MVYIGRSIFVFIGIPNASGLQKDLLAAVDDASAFYGSGRDCLLGYQSTLRTAYGRTNSGVSVLFCQICLPMGLQPIQASDYIYADGSHCLDVFHDAIFQPPGSFH